MMRTLASHECAIALMDCLRTGGKTSDWILRRRKSLVSQVCVFAPIDGFGDQVFAYIYTFNLLVALVNRYATYNLILPSELPRGLSVLNSTRLTPVFLRLIPTVLDQEDWEVELLHSLVETESLEDS